MKSTDKFLIGIVVGVALLVAVAFVLALRRPKPAYQPESSPQGVAHNYLLALRQHEYARAYGCLSPDLPHYPATLDQFTEDVRQNRWSFDFESNSLAVESARVTGVRAEVTVRKSVSPRGEIFDSRLYASTFAMRLKQVHGAWKLTGADEYWYTQWSSPREKAPVKAVPHD